MNKIKRRALPLVLLFNIVLLCFTGIPIGETFTAYAGSGGTFNINDGCVEITESGDYLIEGTGSDCTNSIIVDGDIEVNITIKDVRINQEPNWDNPTSDANKAFVLRNGAKVNLTAEGENYFKGPALTPGIHVPSGTILTIKEESTGSIIAESYSEAAAIGSEGISSYGDEKRTLGTIIINGGVINAKGAGQGAGIGGTDCGNTGSITINGGTVTAKGGYDGGAGIGGGLGGFVEKITITGGEIFATAGISGGAGIGGGLGGLDITDGGKIACGDIQISGGTTSATGKKSGASIGYGYIGTDYDENGEKGSISITDGYINLNGGSILPVAVQDDSVKTYDLTITLFDANIKDSNGKATVIVTNTSNAYTKTYTEHEISYSSDYEGTLNVVAPAGETQVNLIYSGNTYDETLDMGDASATLTMGTNLYPATLFFYDEGVTDTNSITSLTVKQNGTSLTSNKLAYPTSLTKISDIAAKAVIYLPLDSSSGTEITAEVSGINEGDSITLSGQSIASSNNEIIMIDASGNILADELNIAKGDITFSNDDSGKLKIIYTDDEGTEQTVTGLSIDPRYTITGSTSGDSAYQLTVDGVAIKILFKDLTLDASHTEHGAVSFINAADVDLFLEGINIVKGGGETLGTSTTSTIGNAYAGIYVQKNCSLSIADATGTGSLEAIGKSVGNGNAGAAGIGGIHIDNSDDDNIMLSGTITINSGKVTATGERNAAGIGTAFTNEASSLKRVAAIITINGGTIYANGGNCGAGIGGGYYGTAPVVINGGTIIAVAKNVAFNNIGEGYKGKESTITINGGSIPNGFKKNPTNGTKDLYETEVDLNAYVGANASVKGNSSEISDYDYGFNDVYTDDNGKIYIYLPANAEGEMTEAKFKDYYFEGNITMSCGTLKRAVKMTLGAATDISVNSASIPVTLGEGADVYYVVTSDGTTYSTADELIAAAGEQKVSIGAEVEESVALTGLESSKAYNCYMVAKNAEGVYSSIKNVSFAALQVVPNEADVSIDYETELVKAEIGVTYALEAASSEDALDSSGVVITSDGTKISDIVSIPSSGSDAATIYIRKKASEGISASVAVAVTIPARAANGVATVIDYKNETVTISDTEKYKILTSNIGISSLTENGSGNALTLNPEGSTSYITESGTIEADQYKIFYYVPAVAGLSFASEVSSVKISSRPAKPNAPEAIDSNITDKIVNLTVILGAEYQKGLTGTWQDSVEFDSLTANTTYEFYARIKATDTSFTSIVSSVGSVETKKTQLTVTTNPKIAGIYGNKVEDMNLTDGICESKGFAISGTWAITDVNKTDIPKVGMAISYEVTFTPIGNLYDVKTVSIVPAITPKDLTTLGVTVSDITGIYTYTGLAQKPDITVSDSNAVITSDDYTVSYSDNINVGTATVTVTSKGNYQGVVSKTFTIGKANSTINVASETVDKTYGDDDFNLSGITNNVNGDMTYISDNESVATVDNFGKITIIGVGNAKITVSLAAINNFEAAESKAVTIQVEKKTVNGISKEQLAVVDLAKEYSFDLSKLLPTLGDSQKYQNIKYSISNVTNTDAVLEVEPKAEDIVDGKLKLKVANVTQQGKTAKVVVGFISDNHIITEATITVKTTIDTTAIDTAIAAANDAKKNIIVNDNIASSVSKGKKFVATAEMNELKAAIASAEIAKTTSTSLIEVQAVAEKLNNTVTTFKETIKIGTHKQGGGGSSSGHFEPTNAQGNESTIKPQGGANSPIEVVTNVIAKIDDKGNAIVSIMDKDIEEAIKKAQVEAKKKGKEKDGIAVEINAITKKKFNSITANLPKALLEKLISEKVEKITIVSKNEEIVLDLEALKQIKATANADVNITVGKVDYSKLSGEAKTAIDTRPVYDFKVSYGQKIINNFGKGKVFIAIPYELNKVDSEGNISKNGILEKIENLYIIHIDDNGKVTYLNNSSYDKDRKMMIYQTNHFSYYAVAYKVDNNATRFSDIVKHWAKNDIEFVSNRGILKGIEKDIFSPNSSMTRGMFITALGRLAQADVTNCKTSSFTDVKKDIYYLPYIEWANKNNIVNGISETKFAPNKAITREEMAVIIANYAKAMGVDLPSSCTKEDFTDNIKISNWAKESVKKMNIAGIIEGKSENVFDPKGTATRAEVSSVIRRFVEMPADSTI